LSAPFYSRSGGFEGIGFAATSNVAREILLSRSSKFFGIDALLLPFELARILNVPQESGWLVQHVVKGSPADLSGVRGGFRWVKIDDEELLLGGDIILQVDDIRITGEASMSLLREYLNRIDSLVKHRIVVLRAGEVIDLFWISSDIK
jgi:serine protease Do